MWTFILFGISVFGIGSLFVLKNWELRRGSIPGTTLRASTDAHVVVVAGWARLVPIKLQATARTFLAQSIFHVSAIMLRVVHFAERKLIRVINLVKGRGDVTTKKGSASFFLQNVATYKEPQSTVE